MCKDIVWVNEQVKLCQNLYTNFMWGKDYERLRAEAEELEVIFMSLTNFSETRLEIRMLKMASKSILSPTNFASVDLLLMWEKILHLYFI